MNRLFKVMLVLSVSIHSLWASPTKLITHNTTDVESNAFIAGTVESQHPTAAYSDGVVSWIMVRMACIGYEVNNKCPALIKMKTDTPHPVDLGTVELDLDTGEITPSMLSAHGYRLTVNGPGETTLTKE